MEGQVPAKLIRIAIDAAVGLGIAREEVLAGLQLPDGALTNPEIWVPLRAWRDVWLRAVALTSEPALGILAARTIELGFYGVLEYAIYSAPTVGQAIPLAARYFRLANTWGRVEVEACGDLLKVSRHIVGDEQGFLPPQAAEYALASMVQIFRRAAAEALPLSRVTFRHAAPAHTAPHQRFFGCAVLFGAPEDAIFVPEYTQKIATRRPDSNLAAVMEAHGKILLSEVAGVSPKLAVTVRHEVSRLVNAGIPTLETVARRLGQSSRSLQRRLADEGTSYRTIVEDVQWSLAKRYLEAGMPASEVAFVLGYSEVSAFHRAYRAWARKEPNGVNCQ